MIADLFVEFCSYSGLHSRKLIGYAKSQNFKFGTRFIEDKEAGHAWNAVLVCNQWRLMDAMWGGSYAVIYMTHTFIKCLSQIITRISTENYIFNKLLFAYRSFDEKTEKTNFGLCGFYFLPDPVALALNHFCTDGPWRLFPNPSTHREARKPPHTLTEFENDPRMPGFIEFRCSQVFESAYLKILQMSCKFRICDLY